MSRVPLCMVAVTIGLILVPCGESVSRAANTQFIRVATLVPRDSDLAKSFLKIDAALRRATHDSWGLHLYAGGVAGDEPEVLRKMKIGQMDASIITTTGLSHIVKEIAVADSPGVIDNYVQYDAVTQALEPEWEQAFDKAGFKLIGLSDTGEYRWFSKLAITRPSDLKSARPWLWPASFILKEIYQVVGCNGVPLGVPEVYGALQTGMIDTVISTAAALVALQWHPKLNHVTKQSFGVLINGLVMNGAKWKALPPEVSQQLLTEARTIMKAERTAMRTADQKAYRNLLARGYTADDWGPGGHEQYIAMEKQVRDRLVGRLYSPELLARVMAIAAKAK